MKNKLLRFWNVKPLGLFISSIILLKTLYLTIYEKISSFFWSFNFGKCGKEFFIQKGAQIRFPANISIGNNVSIGRNVNVFSEFSDSKLIIGNDSQINRKVELDFSGDLILGENVVVSEYSCIMSHSHKLDPKSKAIKIKKSIGSNVWIGQYATILPQVKKIGENSIVASGSVVTKDVPENVIVAGNPAKVIKKII
jgi:acetyltransferase-like isoleucine patch superfamily enzyme